MVKIRLMKDVARAAGVSQGMAFNVFNRPEVVSARLRDAVRAAASRLGYRGPPSAGRALPSGKSHLIALVVDRELAYLFETSFTNRRLTGIGAVCDDRGLPVVSTETGRRDGGSFETAIVDGLILFCIEQESRLIGLAHRRGVPFVAIDTGSVLEVPTVNVDDRAAAGLAARHLHDLGHRRFGILSPERLGDGRTGAVDKARRRRDRLRRHDRAFAAAGSSAADVDVFKTLNERASVVAAVDTLLDQRQTPTASLAISDTLAIIAVERHTARDVPVPKDVARVGFDDVPKAAAATVPLTTIHQPVRAKGHHATHILLGLEPRGVVQRSTAPHAG